MRRDDGHIGTNLTIWGVISGSALLAGVFEVETHWAVWIAITLWGLLWLIAVVSLTDGSSRNFLAGTLRKSTFTQIYTKLTRRNVMWVWDKLCDEAPDNSTPAAFFRAALTWRLYDKALLIAVAYPIFLITAQWIINGEQQRFGDTTFISEADFWPNRIAILAGLSLLPVSLVLSWSKPFDQIRIIQKYRGIFFSAVAVGVFTGIGSAANASDFTMIVSIALVYPFMMATDFPNSNSASIITAFILAFSGIFAASGAGSFGTAISATAIIIGLLFIINSQNAVDFIFCYEIEIFSSLNLLGTILIAFCWITAASMIDWNSGNSRHGAFYLFLGVFPLINALFDVLSYAITLTLLRRGLRAKWPFILGAADLVVALVLFLLLGITLTAVIHVLNTLAGVPLLNLGALFAGVKTQPWDYLWLYLMLFSTILPTALHLLVSLLGVQGIWPRTLRRPVAGWVDSAPNGPMPAVGAALGLTVIWFVPIALLFLALWLLWTQGGWLVLTFLGHYFDLLLWIAHVPVGAF